jgi:signal transduction histidine kinase
MNKRQSSQIKAQENLNQLKDDFLSTVSHELRSPVTNIKMATQMLKVLFQDDDMRGGAITARLGSAPVTEQPTSVSESACEVQQSALKTRGTLYIQILERECDQEINLLSNFLDLQQLDAGTYGFSHTAIQLENWLPQVIKPFLARIATQQQNLQVNVSDRLTEITTDPISLERILGELLTNACKFTPPGGSIKLAVEFPAVAVAEGSETLQLKVTNSRVEIPASEFHRIFERFYRLNSDRWRYGGTGLGLALVQKMTDYLGGTIGVESGSGQTSFTVTVPISTHDIAPI